MFPTIDPEKLTITRRTDADGATYVSYSFAEFKCLARELCSRTGKQAASAQGLTKDMEIVIDSLGYAMHIEDAQGFEYGIEDPSTPPTQSIKSRIISSLVISSIVTYCRGFSASEARNLQVQDPELKTLFTSEQLALHKKIKFWRNSWIAHAGNSEMEASKCVEVVLDIYSPSEISIFGHTAYSFHPGRERMVEFLNMAKILKARYIELVGEKSKLVNEERKAGIFDKTPFLSELQFQSGKEITPKKGR